MPADLVMWIGWTALIVIYLGLVYIAWRALFRDHGKGRRRCPRCWFDLEYSPGMTCGECGYIGTSERQFHRTRRHYRRALAAVMACVLIVLGGNFWVTQRGWVTIIPDKVLILMLPFSATSSSNIRRELFNRMRVDALSDFEWRMVLNRTITGHAGSRPTSPGWRARYGRILDQCRPAMARDRDPEGNMSEHERMLLDLPADIDIRSRGAWPVDVDPVVHMTMRDWWPISTDARLHITPHIDGMEPVVIYRNGDRPPWSGYPIELTQLGADIESVSFDVQVDLRPPGEEMPWIDGLVRTIDVPLKRRGTTADLMEAVEDEALTAAIRATFESGVAKWKSGRVPVRIFWNGREAANASFDDIAIGVHVDIMRDGLLARRLDIWWLAGNVDDRQVGYRADEIDEDALTDANQDDGRWSVRITGDPGLAMRAGDPKKYWKGRITMPLRVTEYDEEAPKPRWWSEDDAD